MEVSHRIAAFLAYRGIIPEEPEKLKVYEYGLELILGDIINFLSIVLLSVCLQGVWTGLLYLLCFTSVRIFSGGYHAKTHMRCNLTMIVWYLLFSALNIFLIKADWRILSVGTLMTYVPLIRYAPAPNENRPLSQAMRRKCCRRAVIVYTGWVILAALFTLFGVWGGTVIFSTLWMVSSNIVFAMVVRVYEGGEKDVECV